MCCCGSVISSGSRGPLGDDSRGNGLHGLGIVVHPFGNPFNDDESKHAHDENRYDGKEIHAVVAPFDLFRRFIILRESRLTPQFCEGFSTLSIGLIVA